MGLAKKQKTNAYFKTFQTKFRRRRECKTDYYARKNLIVQDLNKFGTPKYRFVVRITNNKVICQVAYATLQGDRVICEANSKELAQYGLSTGFTNYPSCYATGLLLARRLLKSLKMDTVYTGVTTVDGKDYDASAENKDKKPFKAILDLGLKKSSIGSRVFGAMKGACDGGLHIPHSVKNFPGNVKEGKKSTYDPEVHRAKIFGCVIDEYMGQLEEEDKEKYKKQFALWDKCLSDNKLESLEELYTKIHAEIRKNPDRKAPKKESKKHAVDPKDKNVRVAPNGKKYLRCQKIGLEQRKKNNETKIKLMLQN